MVGTITRELLTRFCATGPEYYPSAYTRAEVRERVWSFLRYCFEAQIDNTHPRPAAALPKIKIEQPPTLPLTAAEYTGLLEAVMGLLRTRSNGPSYTRSP